MTNPTPVQELSAGIYVASKVKHAEMWRDLRHFEQMPIISTWIDEAGHGESADLSDLWRRCIAEASGAAALLIYRRPDEVLKGAWIELGAALASGVPVYAVGIEEFTVAKDKRIQHFPSLVEARAAIKSALVTELQHSRAEEAVAPEGWVLVSRVMTPEMHLAWQRLAATDYTISDIDRAYAAMLSASPAPSATGVRVIERTIAENATVAGRLMNIASALKASSLTFVPNENTAGILRDAARLLLASTPSRLAATEQALTRIMANPHGCPFCDSGKLRNPAKGHDETCGFAMASALVEQP